MEVILLESVRKLGVVGSKVCVKDGFGRNYLIPRQKALRATKENLALFEQKKALLEQENETKHESARLMVATFEGVSINIVRQAGEDGRLFGSVTSRDIGNALKQKGFDVDRSGIVLKNPIKAIGAYEVSIILHPEVSAQINVCVVRSAE